VKTQKETNSSTGRAVETGQTLSEITEASAAVPAGPHSKDRAPTPISLPKFLHRLGTAYRLSRVVGTACLRSTNITAIDIKIRKTGRFLPWPP